MTSKRESSSKLTEKPPTSFYQNLKSEYEEIIVNLPTSHIFTIFRSEKTSKKLKIPKRTQNSRKSWKNKQKKSKNSSVPCKLRTIKYGICSRFCRKAKRKRIWSWASLRRISSRIITWLGKNSIVSFFLQLFPNLFKWWKTNVPLIKPSFITFRLSQVP